ncbi:hypothetical protein BDZ94DRAFT_974927 [Collybia nuda]|uniref:EamA domain-containing protein n=1 Tax=Collybia nuda TaxID=64659 RepID=A0A9P5YCR8_9AGAR|nr:hypothetical protein BDZ94DRAFT_974927 [Collybia nuda]
MNTQNAYTTSQSDAINDFARPDVPEGPSKPFLTNNSLLNDIDEGQEVEAQPKWRVMITTCHGFMKGNVGLLLVMSAQAFFSFMGVSVKILHGIDPPISTFQLIVVRMTITYVCCIIYMLATGTPDPFLGPKGVRLLLFLRGLFGFGGLVGLYYSLNYLSLSDSTVLTFLVPLCTGFSGALFLGETFTVKQGIASFFSICGVVLIARPPILFRGPLGSLIIPPNEVTPAQRLIAVGVALIGVIGATGAYTTIRAIGKRAHPMHSMSLFSLLCSVVASIGMVITHEPFVIPTRLDWISLLILIGVFGFLAQILLTMGIQRETVGRSTMAVYTQIVFATILERVFFKTTPPILSVIGTTLILASALYVALTKNTKPETKVATVDSIHEADLEEGLLERSSLEGASDSTIRPYSRESLDAEETSALDHEGPTKPLT